MTNQKKPIDLDAEYRAEGWGKITDAAFNGRVAPMDVESNARHVARYAHEQISFHTDKIEAARRQLAATVSIAISHAEASGGQKFGRYLASIKGILEAIDILGGDLTGDLSTCEGCEKTIRPEDPRLRYDDGPETCSKCTPPEYADGMTYGYRSEDADADIAHAREWVEKLMGSEGEADV